MAPTERDPIQWARWTVAQTKRPGKAADQELIEPPIDPEWDRYPSGRADARLKDHGVPDWALVAPLHAIAGDLDELARDYDVPREAVDGAMAYYRQKSAWFCPRTRAFSLSTTPRRTCRPRRSYCF